MLLDPEILNKLHADIEAGRAFDPLIFLQAIMTGKDPRHISHIYTLITDIDDFCDGVPDREDWEEIVAAVKSEYKFSPVSLSESIGASKSMAEYLHPKRRQTDLAVSDSTTSIQNSPLTEEEIALFKEKFNADF